MNLYARLKSIKLEYYESQVEGLREAREEVESDGEIGRDLVLNHSLRVNECQTQGMILAKRTFLFDFIEKEVEALRYQEAPERNYE